MQLRALLCLCLAAASSAFVPLASLRPTTAAAAAASSCTRSSDVAMIVRPLPCRLYSSHCEGWWTCVWRAPRGADACDLSCPVTIC